MNEHAATLKAWYEAYRPESVGELSDEWFAEEGERISTRICDVEVDFRDPTVDRSDFLAAVGDAQRARLAAQEAVYAEEMPVPESS